MEQTQKTGAAPALTLMILAPLLTEVLPGATRFSSLFVLPIEIFVWGGGAVLIRAAVRRWQLGWINMLFLAIGLAIAEECIIQQTSFAPLVIKLKVWAIVYESVFVVFLPVYLCELIYPTRRQGTWLNKFGVILISVLFLVGSFLAWFTWTRIARPKFYHLPVYVAPSAAYIIAVVVILILIYLWFHPMVKTRTESAPVLKVPSNWIIATAGAIWAILWYGLLLLGFGIAPHLARR